MTVFVPLTAELVENIYINFVVLDEIVEIKQFKPPEPLNFYDSLPLQNLLVENIYINFVVLVEMAEISSFKPLEPLTNDSFSTTNCTIY